MSNKMHKHPSCSFHSSCTIVNSSELSAMERSIMKEYDRLKGYEETPQYSIDSIAYCELPKFLNLTVKTAYTQCIYLDRFTFYEMFTILIVQYLFKSPDQSKTKKINNLKALIYSPDFLEGNLFTKGLLIKGFRILEESAKIKDNSHPLGQLLLTCDFICTFTECWKELIRKICIENNVPTFGEDEIDSSIFELFSSYFHVNFDVYWKERGNRLWKEHFTFDEADKNSDTLALVVNPEYQISVSQRSIKITESRSSHLSSSNRHNISWNYILLTNPPADKKFKIASQQINTPNKDSKFQKAQLTNGEEISRISEIDYSCGETEEIKILLEDKMIQNTTAKKTQKSRKTSSLPEEALSTIASTVNKGKSLIEDMKRYLEELESLNHQSLQAESQHSELFNMIKI